MSILRRFGRASSGNFAIGTALLSVPLVFVIGAVVDLSRGYGARSLLQSAVDGAALAVVKSSGFDQDRANEIARQMILANYGEAYGDLDVQLTGEGATVTAQTKVATTLSAVLGFREVAASVSARVEYPQTRYEIVLVLDTTGSMAGAKIDEMRKAASEMVDELSGTPMLRDRVRFALVPFSNAVNVGADKADAGWIDSDGRNYLPNSIIPNKVDRRRVFGNLGTSWKGCVEARLEEKGEKLATDDTPPTAAVPRTLFVPLLAPDEPTGFANNYVRDDTLAGLGLDVTSDAADNDTVLYHLVSDTLKVVGSLLGGGARGGDPNQGCDSRPILPLSDKPEAVKDQIALLQAKGATNITEGVAWGQRVLSPGAPFTGGAAPGADVEKIMVLLTDGDNTITPAAGPNGSAYSAYGYLADGRWNKEYQTNKAKTKCRKIKDGSSKVKACAREAVGVATAGSAATVTAAMNAETAAACLSAKEAGSELYAIRLEVNSAASSTLLSNCASDGSHYYDARSAADLKGIFKDIAQRIMKLKITS